MNAEDNAHATANADQDGHADNSATSAQSEKIRALNDAFRTTLTGGRIMITSGLVDRDAAFQQDLFKALQTYNQFTEENDPYGEHDFGSFSHCGETILFKIDYYDLNLQYHSPDATDPTVTVRVLTLMLAQEW